MIVWSCTFIRDGVLNKLELKDNWKSPDMIFCPWTNTTHEYYQQYSVVTLFNGFDGEVQLKRVIVSSKDTSMFTTTHEPFSLSKCQ